MNVWGCFGPWRERAPRLLETPAELRPDIVRLHETWAAQGTSQAEEWAARLGLHAVFGRSRMPQPPPVADAVECGLAVLGRRPVLDHRRDQLPDGADGPVPAKDPSVALGVTFGRPAGALHVVTACPDRHADRGAARLSQALALAHLLADPALDGPLPVLLAADLNARRRTPGFQALTLGLVDAWAWARPGQPGHAFTTTTWNGFVDSHEWLADGRIDHVLARSGGHSSPSPAR